MRALLITCSAWHPKLPVHLFGEQIIAGPAWPDAQTLHGQWRSLRTASGDYDVADLLRKIPTDQQPDLLVCFGDSAATSRPCNVKAFPGRKIMALASSLSRELKQSAFFRYLSVERFDHIVAAETNAALADLLHAERDRVLEPASGGLASDAAMESVTAVAC